MQPALSFSSSIRESFYWSKWLTFAASALIMLCAGHSYSFSIYSDVLKARFGLSQTQLSGLGTAINLGGYLSVLPGAFYDGLIRYNRKGPLLTIIIGAALNFTGYACMFLSATGVLAPPYWGLLLILAMSSNGQCWFETGCMITSTRNFETERGTVIGILKAFLGLSASTFTAIYICFLDGQPLSFILLLGIVPSAVALTCCIFVNYVPYIQIEPHTKSHAFHLAFTAVVGLAAYQAVIALARNEAVAPLDLWSGILVLSAILILLLPVISLPCIFGGLRSKRLRMDVRSLSGSTDSSEHGAALPGSDALPPELVPFLEADSDAGAPNAAGSGPTPFRDRTPAQCLRSYSFWLIIFAYAVCSGAGLTYLNNLQGLIAAIAVGGEDISQAVYVSCFSILNCIGRLCSGFIPDKLMVERGVPRTVCFAFLAGLTAVSALLNAFARPALLGTASCLAGFAFGSFQGVTPAIISEVFGLTNLATNYALGQIAPAIGSYLFATTLAGAVYSRALARQGGGGATCRGPQCFRVTFLVLAVLSAASMAAAVMLWHRNRGLYAGVIAYTRAERRRRGVQGEVAQRRVIMKRIAAENALLQTVVARGRGLVANLQAALAPAPPSPAVAAAVADLGRLVGQADALLAGQAKLYRNLDDPVPGPA